MKHLWAPWRRTYLHSFTKLKRVPPQATKSGCLFCTASRSKADRKHWVLFRGKQAFAIMNLYPYTAGHLMVAPARHVPRPDLLNDAELLDLWHIVHRFMQILDKEFHPDGFNVGLNVGRSAGAGIPGHMHVHIVPRWHGDTNFMPVVASTKVISDSMESLYKTLRSCSLRAKK